jgi:hypothetical protein
MSVAGVFPGDLRPADDGVAVDVDQASGRSDAAARAAVLEHGAGLLLGEVGREQGRALAFGEAVIAGLAVEQPEVIVLAVACADGEVSGIALAKEGAIGLLAAEAREVVPGTAAPRRPGRVGLRVGESDASGITTPVPRPVFHSSETRPNRETEHNEIASYSQFQVLT